MNVDDLKTALLSQENYKNTKSVKDAIQKSDTAAMRVCTTAIHDILKDQKEPMQMLMAMRLAKEIIEMQQQDFIRLFSTTVLPQMERIAAFKKEDKSEGRGKQLFAVEPSKQQAQVGNSLFRLILDSIQVWSHWYPLDPATQAPSPFKRAYEQLLAMDVSFPKLSYYKPEDLTKRNAVQSEILGVQRSNTMQKPTAQSTIHQPVQKASTMQDQFNQQQKQQPPPPQKPHPEKVRERANAFLNTVKGEIELVGDILTSEEGSEELEMLEECTINMMKFKDQAEELLLDLMELDFDGKDKLMEDLLLKQDFLEEFVRDFDNWQKKRQMTYAQFKKKYYAICSPTPNPDHMTPNPDFMEPPKKSQPSHENVQQKQPTQSSKQSIQQQAPQELAPQQPTQSSKQSIKQAEQFHQPELKSQPSQQLTRKTTFQEPQYKIQEPSHKTQDPAVWQESQLENDEGSAKVSNLNPLTGASLARKPTTFHSSRAHSQPQKEVRFDAEVEEDDSQKNMPNDSLMKSNRHSPRNNLRSSLSVRQRDTSLEQSRREVVVASPEVVRHPDQTKNLELIQHLSQEISVLEHLNQELETELQNKTKDIEILKQLTTKDKKVDIMMEENDQLRKELKELKDNQFTQVKAANERTQQQAKEKNQVIEEQQQKISVLQKENAHLLEELRMKEQDLSRLIKEGPNNREQDMILHLTKENSRLLQDNKKWQMLCEQQAKQLEERPVQPVPQPIVAAAQPTSQRNRIFEDAQRPHQSAQPYFNRQSPQPVPKNNLSWMQSSQMRRPLRSESLQGSRMPTEEDNQRQLHPNFNAKMYNSRIKTAEVTRHKFVPRPLLSQQRELIFPYVNPLDYYEHKVQKPPKGKFILTTNISQVILDQSNLDNLKITILKSRHTLFVGKYLVVGAVLEAQLTDQQKQVKLGLYFVNEIKGVQLEVQVSYSISQQELLCIPINVDEHFTLTSDRQLKHEFLFGLQEPTFQLQTAQVELRINQRQVIYEFQLPISIYNFVDFQRTKLPVYKKLWRSNIPNVYRSEAFKLNQRILADAEDLGKFIPELIEINPHKKEDYRAGIDEIKYGGIWQLRWSQGKYLVRFVIRPTQEMMIQMVQVEGNKDQKIIEQLINTMAFIFTI